MENAVLADMIRGDGVAARIEKLRGEVEGSGEKVDKKESCRGLSSGEEWDDRSEGADGDGKGSVWSCGGSSVYSEEEEEEEGPV